MSKKSTKKEGLSQKARQQQEIKQMKKLDPSCAKQDIYSLLQELTKLNTQKANAEQQIINSEKQHLEQTYELAEQMKSQEEEMDVQQSRIDSLKHSYQCWLSNKEIEGHQQIENMLIEKSNQKQNLIKELEQQQQRNEYLERFRVKYSLEQNRQKGYKQELQEYQQRYKRMKQSEQNYKVRIDEEYRQKELSENKKINEEIERIKNKEIEILEKKMTKQQQIKKYNNVMNEQIQLYNNEKYVLQQQCRLLQQQVQNQKNINSNQQLNGQATQTYQRSMQILKLQARVAKLNQYLSDQCNKIDNELKNTKKHYENQRKELEDKIAQGKRWLKGKQKDIQKVKSCSQMVLNKRSHLQSYLLEVFHEHPDIDHTDPVNINQLLRFLFIKINGKHTPISYHDYFKQQPQPQQLEQPQQ